MLNNVSFTGNECRKKWFTLRDGFRRSLKKRKTTTGQAVKKLKPWRFEKQMEFIRPCFEARSQLSSLDDGSENDDTEDDGEQFDDQESVGREGSQPSVSSPSSQSVGSTNVHITKEPTNESRRKKTSKNHTTPPRAAEVLQSYLEKKSFKQPEDQLTKFFQAMELTVSSFPYLLQVETKRKIFQVVTDAEMSVVNESGVNNTAPPQPIGLQMNRYQMYHPQTSTPSQPDYHYHYNQGQYSTIYPSSQASSSSVYQENQITGHRNDHQ